mmetsp:Transcript_34940/g.99172  ORF Transcript_34940/g.99172 Transcript_34940/m.99172 type:complete len:96 (+) Transcript_34940:800-1087(+)
MLTSTRRAPLCLRRAHPTLQHQGLPIFEVMYSFVCTCTVVQSIFEGRLFQLVAQACTEVSLRAVVAGPCMYCRIDSMRLCHFHISLLGGCHAHEG